MIEINKIYNEDCLITLNQIPDKSIDFTLTDPPYGINLNYDIYKDTEENWYSLILKVLPEIIRVSNMVILPCCKISKLGWFYENFKPDWIMCWYKGSTGHRSYIGFNDWEPHLVFGKTKNRLYVHDFFQTRSSYKKNTFGHPCPKPLEWAKYFIKNMTDENMLIYDPFVGSGTVPYICKKLNRNFIGSEISKKYCEISNRRLEQINFKENKQKYFKKKIF